MFDRTLREELESGDLTWMCHRDVGMRQDFSYTFSKQTGELASSVLNTLKEDMQHCQNGSSLWGSYCHFLHCKGRQTDMEKESEFPDMETELSSTELFDACNMAASQLTRTDDNIISQQHTGMHII